MSLEKHDVADGGSPPPPREDLVLTVQVNPVSDESEEPDQPEESNQSTQSIPTLEMIGDAQKSDPFCIEIMQDPNVMDGSDSPFTVRDSIGENFDKPYFKMPNGNLMHRYYNAAGVGVCYQIVVPEKYHRQIIRHIHYSSVAGHLGIAKTRAMILKAGFWFPHMLAKVKHVVSHCRGCQRSKAHKNSNLSNQQARWTRLPQVKWQQVSIDFCGPLTADRNGFRYLLVVMDTFSKYCVVIPTKNMEAMTVARCLFFDICLVFGFPQSILSDHAANFRTVSCLPFTRF